MAARTTPWEPTLDNAADIRAFLDAAVEGGHPQTIASALGWVARACSMGSNAEPAGLGRECLGKSLSEDGNARLATMVKVVRARA